MFDAIGLELILDYMYWVLVEGKTADERIELDDMLNGTSEENDRQARREFVRSMGG